MSKLENNAVELAINYLKILQDGRAKPDKHGKHPFIMESIDNVPSITKVRDLLNKYFENELRHSGHQHSEHQTEV